MSNPIRWCDNARMRIKHAKICVTYEQLKKLEELGEDAIDLLISLVPKRDCKSEIDELAKRYGIKNAK